MLLLLIQFLWFYNIFYPFSYLLFFFIDKEKILEKNDPNNNNNRNGGNEDKKDLSNFKPQVFIIFKLCLNHIYPLLGQIEDAIIINTVFVIFIIFLSFLLFTIFL